MGETVNRTLKSLLFILSIYIAVLGQVKGNAPEILGIISQEPGNIRDETGTLLLYPKIAHKLLLVGTNFSEVEKGQAQIAFTLRKDPSGNCDDYDRTKSFDLTPTADGQYASVTVTLEQIPNTKLSSGNVTNKYLYICSKKNNDWVHQGDSNILRVGIGEIEPPKIVSVVTGEPDSTINNDGSILLYSNEPQNIFFVGQHFDGFKQNGQLAFTTKKDVTGSCGIFLETNIFNVTVESDVLSSVSVSLQYLGGGQHYYICLRNPQKSTEWIHQGSNKFLTIDVRVRVEKTTMLPMSMQIIIIASLLVLSGLFSGLNLGLMALDKTELKIIERCGSKSEKKYAKTISPVRKRGNFLLCTLLLGNVLVNNSLTILLDDLSNGLIAVIAATMGIVIFGEIIPQAVCSRHGLAVGARTIWITRIFMVLTFPLSFPISLLLDKILGEEIGHVYDREKLQELIRVTKDFNELKNDEVNIIAGALELTRKSVTEVMTKIEDVFMIDINSKLDFDTIAEIQRRGYTRIPVYEGDKTNIVHLLNIKDLTLIDPDDKTQLKTVLKFYQHPLIYVFDDLKLDAMLTEFRQGHSHLAVIRRVNSEGDGDPFYETLGVLTLEDVIEEIIQSEIIDETDTLTDNRQKKQRRIEKQDFSMFTNPEDGHKPWISSHLALAAFQFLSTSVDLFKEEYISPNVLKRLIKQNIYEEVINNEKKECQIYKENSPCDFFVLILEGHGHVSIGKEKLEFDGGPFTYYGVQALEVNESSLTPQHSTDSIYLKGDVYIPDFSLKATSTIIFLKIRRAHYIASRKVTLIGKTTVREEEENEAYDREMQKASWLTNASNNSDLILVDKKSLAQHGRTSSQPSLPNKVRSESTLSGRSTNSEKPEESKPTPTRLNENYVYQNSPTKENGLVDQGDGDKKEELICDAEELTPMISYEDQNVKDNVPLTSI
ncbi:unextended protein-like [Mytilus galloprovincialis]|uniref:unextended protein-like n=1 Tax=Mytilus galloprovincialis TaxID=29158 RepID=UPI003F7B78DA